jgi:predicted phosphoribosyltransferase
VSPIHCRQCLSSVFALEIPPENALVYAISAGGVEVAGAIALFQGQPIVWLEDHELSDAIATRPEVFGRPVLLIDDGLSPLDRLIAAAAALANGAPLRLQLVTPWLARSSRLRLETHVDAIATLLRRAPRKVPYEEPADVSAARAFVAQSVDFHRYCASDLDRGAPGYAEA